MDAIAGTSRPTHARTARAALLSGAARMLLVLAIFGISCARERGSWSGPFFYAEDGFNFFRESVELGVRSLWTPIVGQFHVVARAIALVARVLPISWAPWVFASLSGLFAAVALSWFARPGFRWLVPSDGARLVACLAFALLPGRNELSFKLCMLNYDALLLATLLLIERDANGRFAMGSARLLGLVVLSLSSGQTLFLVPAAAWLWWRERDLRYALFVLAVGAITVLNARDSVRFARDCPLYFDSPGKLGQALEIYAGNLMVRGVVLPAGGHAPSGWLLSAGSWVVAAAALAALAALATAAVPILRTHPRQRTGLGVMALVILATYLTFPLAAHVRIYLLPALTPGPGLWLRSHHAFVPAALTVVVWWTLLAHSRLPVWAQWLGAVLVTANLASVGRWAEPAMPPNPEWADSAARIEDALQRRARGELARPVRVPIQWRPAMWNPDFRWVTVNPAGWPPPEVDLTNFVYCPKPAPDPSSVRPRTSASAASTSPATLAASPATTLGGR